MTTRPDMTRIEDWLDPDLIEQTAQAMRSDAAAFRALTDQVEPVWRDLPVHFSLILEDGLIYWAGSRVTDYGKAVGQGADNIATILEECASTIRGMEDERQEVLEQARDARVILAQNPMPEPPPQSTLMYDDASEYDRQVSSGAWAEGKVEEASDRIDSLFQRYRECLVNTALDIDSLKDDGGTPPWWIPPGFMVDVGLIIVGIFFPPVAIAGTAMKTMYTEYQGRKKELLEEHPELSDNEIRTNAAGHAAVATPIVVAASVGAGRAGGAVAGRAGASGAIGVADGVTGWVFGVGGSAVLPDAVGTPEPGAPATQPVFAPPGSSERPATVRPPLAPDPTLDDPDRIQDTKDYDRDGYTDPEFLPGPSGQVANPDPDNSATWGIEPAEEVVRKPIDWTRRPTG